MRRFEFKDSKSDKFWEIDTEGSSVTTRWGRTGTDGQTKTKDFDSDAAAAAEAKKQIAAKVKKGYVEATVDESAALPKKAPPAPVVSSPSPSPAPDPAPSPAPASDVIIDEDAFVVPSGWKARLHPRRGGKWIPEEKLKVSDWAKRVRDTDLPDDWDPATVSFDECIKLLKSFAESRNSWQEDPSSRALILWTRARRGVLDGLRLLTHHPLFADGWREPPALREMRIAFVHCSDDERHQAREFLEEQSRRSEKALTFCAYLLPEEAGWRSGASTSPRYAHLLAASAQSVQELQGFFTGAYEVQGVAETLVVEFGEQAVPVLVGWWKIAWNNDTKEQLARALVEIPHDDAVTALFDFLPEKPALKVLPDIFRRYPRRAIRLGLGRSALDIHLRGWVLEAKSAAEALLDELDDSGCKKLLSLLDASTPQHPEAKLEELPRLFTEPPWTRKKAKGVAPIELEVDLPPVSAVLTEEENSIAEAVLVAAKEVGPAKDSLGRYMTPAEVVAAVLGGRNADLETELTGQYWYDERARELAFGLIKAAPDRAGGLLEAARDPSSATYTASPQMAQCSIPLAAPEMAELFLEGLGKKTQRASAVEWLLRHPEYAARAWLPAAVGKGKKIKSLAQSGLRMLASRGHEDTVRAAAEHYGSEAVEAIDVLLATDPLEVLPKKVPKTIYFFNPSVLPRPKLRGRDEVLPFPAVRILADIFAISSLDEVYEGVNVAKELLEPDSFAAFAWAMFEQWLSIGAPSKESWALTALGLVGNDDIAHRLTPMIRAWPGESQHQRAVAGLDVLLAIGTDVALMHLNGIAQKVKFKGIKTNAQERIEKLAEELNLTRDELADRLVPDLDLEADGTMILDYGPRRFTVGFDEALKPFVKDESGKRLKNLPKPGAKDDTAKAEPAEARFKLLKKNVRSLATLQVRRLQNAMVVGRQWSAADFQTYLVEHPLLVHLVRRVIWGVFDGNELVSSFRVTEDRTFANHEDDEFTLGEEARVGLAHPIDLPAEAAAAWGELFTDYEILQPFPQLGRPVYHLTDEEKQARAITRHKDTTVEVGRVLGLMSRGWERGEAQDGGAVWWFSLPLPDGKHEARLWLGGAGIWIGMGSEQTELPTVEVIAVVKRDTWSWQHEAKDAIALGTLPKSLTSELVDTLESLVAE
ncbi:MAG: DUF4132 domain-containing protein [Myxococcota bacterium]